MLIDRLRKSGFLHKADQTGSSSIAIPSSVPGGTPLEAVWTPKGYVITRRESAGSALRTVRLQGGTGYGGTDTSPPTGGFGVGGIYD